MIFSDAEIPKRRVNMLYQPLKREDVIKVIEGCGAANRVPIILDFWVHPESFEEREPIVREIMSRYPEDAQCIGIQMPSIYEAPEDDPSFRWVNFDEPQEQVTRGIDEQGAITDWAQLDSILADFPNPDYHGVLPENPKPDGRYRLGHWWYCLFERHWSLRGMTNALMDYYIDPDSVHRLFRALTDFYMHTMERAKRELNLDGIFTSDDIGTQTAPFFSPEIFREFFKPYYKELINKAHSLDMHFWLHSCGCIEEFLPDLIEIGLDVLHPIQKYTMKEQDIARKYGENICIWAGFDVQQVIPWGTADEVRREVRFLMDTYYHKDGRFMFTAGNGVNGDCPIASLEALYDEAYKYGEQIAQKKIPSNDQ